MKTRLIIIFLLSSILIGGMAGGYLALTRGIPSIDELKHYHAVPGTKIFADDDTLIGELKAEKGIFVPFSKIPKHMTQALIAVEDSRFFKHKGIDYIAIARAVVKDIIHVSLKEGGSTL
ncbi:MAG TPA: transglycosylase domain-containing protein, partial [Thermodesulfovibrionales bacterium]|nr:transglycosylase domain-containing protein [Thermodesulfovibrionales bacterium]